MSLDGFNLTDAYASLFGTGKPHFAKGSVPNKLVLPDPHGILFGSDRVKAFRAWCRNYAKTGLKEKVRNEKKKARWQRQNEKRKQARATKGLAKRGRKSLELRVTAKMRENAQTKAVFVLLKKTPGGAARTALDEKNEGAGGAVKRRSKVLNSLGCF